SPLLAVVQSLVTTCRILPAEGLRRAEASHAESKDFNGHGTKKDITSEFREAKLGVTTRLFLNESMGGGKTNVSAPISSQCLLSTVGSLSTAHFDSSAPPFVIYRLLARHERYKALFPE
ncbi:unnamed protein product, partial [Amoebophrya sp. A25]